MPVRKDERARHVSALVKRVNALSSELASSGHATIKLMEVCGTHTMAISQYGIRRMIGPGVELLSGPGCPVCVTSQQEIDECIGLAGGGTNTKSTKNTKFRTSDPARPSACLDSRPPVVLTFGDMLRVPGGRGSLEQARAEGADVRVLYSALDGVEMAEREPERQFVFLGVGFETTAPTVAAALVVAKRRRLANFSVLSMFKLIPPALALIAGSKRVAIDGFILPGHVSTVIGTKPYEFLARDYGLPSCVTGFEPTDILEGILSLLEQMRDGPKVDNRYERSVRPEGNPTALRLMRRVFEPCDAEWRGLGRLPGSGLTLRPEFATFDARARFPTAPIQNPKSKIQNRFSSACRCGEVMLGLLRPPECRLFGRACTPERPVGPCMVSSEGACAAFWKYREQDL